jgi:hypothetical protein
MKQERGLSEKQSLGYRYNYRLLQQNWLERKLKKIARLRQEKEWRNFELAQYGSTMHGTRLNGEFNWL